MAKLRAREITGAQLLKIAAGALVSDMLIEEGNAFLGKYYSDVNDCYFEDVQAVLTRGLPYEYHFLTLGINTHRLNAALRVGMKIGSRNQE